MTKKIEDSVKEDEKPKKQLQNIDEPKEANKHLEQAKKESANINKEQDPKDVAKDGPLEGVRIVFPLPDVSLITMEREYDHKKKKVVKKSNGEIKDIVIIKDIINNFKTDDQKP